MDTTNIQVGIRIRPLIRREIQTNQACYWNADNKRIYSTEKEYHFDEVFDSTSSTENIYNILGKPLVENAMRGINGTLFAYGQTASGKTHTILGDVNELGILPLAIKEVFDHTVKQPDREFLLRASFIEIYNEEITDLLASKKENIKILTNSENDVVVENLTTHTVISYESTMDLVQKGIINRKIGITNMNERSSRSHLIFRLVIESREISELNNSMEANGTIIAAELNVVDLAGSERAGQTGAQGIRLKESSFINTSLMSLGVVIRKLSEGDKSCHIPYRDSKLTRLLQKSLGGNARTCIICTVSPVVLEETQQTLLFASQAKEVKNRPTVNEVLDDKSMMRKQMNEINLLKKKIIELETGISHSEKDKILAEQISYQQKIEKQRERISLLLKEIVCTGRRSFQNVTKKDNMRRLTWCPGGLLKSGKNFNDIKSFDEDIEMDTLDGSFEKIEFQLLKQEFDEYKAQTCSPDEYIKLKDKLTALEIQHETTKNKLRDLIINQEPHEAVQTLREENSRLCKKNEVLSNDNAKLQAEIDISKAKINALIDDVAMLQEQQESMVDKDYLERLKEGVNAKSLELEESRKKCELENEELIHALANQKKLWNEQVISLEEQKFNLEQELHAANKKIIHECKKSEDFQNELQLLKEQFSILKEENNKAKSQTEMFVDECNNLKSKSDQLIFAEEDIIAKNLLDELELLKQHLSSLNEEKDIAVSEKEMLAKENNDLKLKLSHISFEEDIVKKNLSDELEHLKQHLSSLNEEKDIAVSEKEMLAKENNDLKLKFSHISCEEDIMKKNLSDELELLKQYLNSLNKEKDIAVSEKEMLAKENNDLKLKFSHISCEEDIVKKNLSDELELLKQHLNSLNEEKDIAVSEKELLAKENNDLKLKFSHISCEEDIVKNNLSDELKLLKQHLNLLNEEKNNAVSEKEMLAKENNDLKLKFSHISCEEDIVKKNLTDELELLKQHLTLLNEEKNTAVSEKEMLAKENNHLKLAQISSVEEDIVKKSLLDELELLKQHLSSLNEEKDIAVSEKEMLAKENNDLKLKFSHISCEEDIVKKNLSDELELLKQHLNSLNEEKDIAVSEKEMLAKENNDLKLKFSHISCEEDIVKKNLSDELELLKQHLNSLNEEKNIAVSEKEMLAKENNDLKLKFSHISCEEDIVKKNLSDELELLKQHLNSLNGEKDIAVSEKEMLAKENNDLKLKFSHISCEEEIAKKNLSDELQLLKQHLNLLNEEKNTDSKKEMLAEENNHLKFAQISSVEEDILKKNLSGKTAISEREMLKKEIIGLRLAQISSVDEDIAKKNLSDELELLKQHLNLINEEKNTAVSEKEMLAEENNHLRLAQISSVDEDILKKNSSDELCYLKQQLNSLNEEKNIAVSEKEMLAKENNDLKLAQISSDQEDIVKKNLSDELQLMKQHLSSINQERNITVSQNEMLFIENNDLKLKLQQFHTVEEEIMKKYSSALDELQILKQELNSVNQERNSVVSLNEMLVKENNDMKLRINHLTSIEEDIMQKNLSVLDELQRLKQKFDFVNDEKNISLSKNEMLMKDIDEMKLKFNESKSIEQDLMKKNLLVSDELRSLKLQFNSANEERNIAVSVNEILTKENKELKIKVNQFSFIEEEIMKKNASVLDELNLLKQNLMSVNEERNNTVFENEMLMKKNKELKMKIDQLNSVEEKVFKDNLSDEMQRLKQHLNSIYEEKNNAENFNELLRQENDELKLKVKQYSCSINELEMKILDLTQSYDKNIFEQQKKIKELIDINKEFSVKSNQLSNEKNQISEELVLMTNKFSDIEHNFLVTQTKNHDLMEALKKEQENCAKQCKLSKSAYERKCDQVEAEMQVLMSTLKALKAENIQITEINKVLKSEVLVAKENLECQQNEQITIIDKHEKHIKELQNDIGLLNKKLETHNEVISRNNDLVQKVKSLEETKIELEQSLNKVNKALKENQLNFTEQYSQLSSVVHKENQLFNNAVNLLKYDNLSKEELIDKVNHVEHLLELKKKDISVYNDHRIEQNAMIEQLKKKNEDSLSRLKRLEQILTDLRKPSGNASTREWEEHCISLERIKVRLESQVLHLEERKRVLKLQLERYQQENTHLNVIIKQKDEKFAKASKENEEEKEKLANAIQNLKIDNERVCTGLKDAFNRMNAAEKALTETKSVAELEISKRDSEIERVSNYLIRSYERYQHYRGIAKNCLENKCSAKVKPIQNDVFTMTENYFPVLSEKSTEQLSSQKRRSNEQLEGERQKSRKKLSNSIKECDNEAECNQQ